jgi:hypothetical protein
MADALEDAHAETIVHRDLKPHNIKITPDGKVKVLDFGLAKAMDRATSLDSAPTVAAGHVETRDGAILGTPQYMSPEQARGERTDSRTDIWSYGCVLYELLTGRRAFDGKTAIDALTAVVSLEPDWSALPATTPTGLRQVLSLCLEKDPSRRLQHIGDARVLLDRPAPPSVAPVAPRRTTATRWLAATVVLLALTSIGLLWQTLRSASPEVWTGVRLGGPTVAYSPKVSPDGQWVAFVTIVEGFSQLGVMKPATGNWEVLTHDRSRGQVSNIEWSRDSSRVYYDRFVDVPDGVFSVPVPRGEERLVLENAASPRVLGDGSLVLSQLNAERRAQLHRYWPADGRLEPLNAVLRDFWATVFDVSERGQVVFVGRTLDALEAPDRLYALDLKSARAVPLAPGLSFSRTTQALAVAPDGRSVVLTVDSGDSQHVVKVLTDGSGDVKTLFPVTEFVFYLDVGHDGSVYLDQWDRMGEVVRLSPSGGAPEHIGYNKRSGLYIGIALPLPDGRVVVSARTGGRERLMVMGLGREPVTFAETSEETAAPMTLVAGERVAFS